MISCRMTAVIDYATTTPPALRDTRTTRELFTTLHGEVTALGPRGVLVVFGVLFSSSVTLLARGARWVYRKAAGYA